MLKRQYNQYTHWQVCRLEQYSKTAPSSVLHDNSENISQFNIITIRLFCSSSLPLGELPGVKKMSFAQHPYNVLRNKFGVDRLSNNGFDLMNRFLTYVSLVVIFPLICIARWSEHWLRLKLQV